MLFISNEANDDEYSAKFNPKPNSIDDYRKWIKEVEALMLRMHFIFKSIANITRILK